MEHIPVPFGDDVGLEVLEALKELGESLSKLSDLESVSKTGQQAASTSKQYDILQSVNHSLATSRWSEQQQEMQRQEMEQPLSPKPPPLPTLSPKQQTQILLAKKNSFFVASEANDNSDVHEIAPDCIEEEDDEEEELSTMIESPEGKSPATVEHGNAMNKEFADDCGQDDDDDEEVEMEEEDQEEEGEEEEEEELLQDEDEDEWDDDEDLGYVVLKVSEQEFFEMEEESSFRQQLVANGQVGERGMDEDDGVLEGCLMDTEAALHDHLDLDYALNEDGRRSPQSDQDEDGKRGSSNNVNTSKRGNMSNFSTLDMMMQEDRCDDQLPPSPPQEELEEDSLNATEQAGEEREEDENEEEEEEEGEDDESEDEDDQEDDIAAVGREMGLDFSSSRDEENIATSLTDLPDIQIDMVENNSSFPLPSQSPPPTPPPVGKGRMTAQSRRVSEIMGQKKIRGVDGEHCYFDLKVIFDPFRTGFEDDKHFNPPPGTIIAGRYEMVEVLGQAAFSTALRCIDLDAEQGEDEGDKNQWVCLKVIKNSKDFFDQSLDEIKLLQYINSKGDPHEHNVLQMIDYFYCKEHLFIVSELLRENLYEFQKYIRESGSEEYFTPNRLKKIMKQILDALVYIHSLNLLHCDIKPENIVIKSYSRCEVKLIDFGSSCFVTDHLTSYIQSRSYRAPEVILGMEYNYGIDIWSLGGVLAEMHTAYVLFQNDSIATMLSRIEGILGPYPPHMVESSPEAPKYFNMTGVIYERDEEDGSFGLIYAKKTSLRSRLHLPPLGVASEDEELFLEFVRLMLQIDPAQRPSAEQLLTHPWLTGVDDLDVYYNLEANPPLPDEEDDDENHDEEEEDHDEEEEEEEFVCYGERVSE